MAYESLQERFELVVVGLCSRFRRIFEFVQTAWYFYGNALFRKVDLAMLHAYMFHNPYSVSREFSLLQGEENIYTYGETPLTTMQAIVKRCGITAKDTFYELGCGRGKACFWMHFFVGCDVVGIEYNPYFARRAAALVSRFALPDIVFRCEDMLKSDYSKATVVYLYGSSLDDSFLTALAEKLKTLPPRAKVITVSYSLTDYIDEPFLELVDFFDLPFTWGEATVYVQEKK